jgi:replicative DNA helicase
MAIDRLPPQNIEAEQAVLGALLIDPRAKHDVLDLLPSGALFYRDTHGLIYDAMLAVTEPDYITVSDELRRRGQLEQVGCDSYLVQLMNACHTAVHARHYAEIVAKCACLRQIVQAGYEIAKMPYETSANVDAVFNKAMTTLGAVQPPNGDTDILEWYPSLVGYLGRTIERVESGPAPERTDAPPVRLPWGDLSGEDKIAELLPNSLTMVLADTSVGKTAFAECCAEAWAIAGLHTVFVHLELSHEFMLHRRMARHTGIPLARLLHPLTRDDDIAKVSAVTGEMSRWPGAITYVDAAGWTARKIAAVVERIHQRHPVNAFVVDYLTMIELEDRNVFAENSAQATGRQINTIKALSKRLSVPGMLLAQFNNEADGQTWQKSKKVRNTGEARQKANLIITLDRPVLTEVKIAARREYHPGELDPLTKVIVEKHTAGRPFSTYLFFDGPRYWFRDCQVRQEALTDER